MPKLYICQDLSNYCIPRWFMPLRDRSGLSSHFGTAYVAIAAQVCLGSLESVGFLGAHTSYTLKRGMSS